MVPWLICQDKQLHKAPKSSIFIVSCHIFLKTSETTVSSFIILSTTSHSDVQYIESLWTIIRHYVIRPTICWTVIIIQKYMVASFWPVKMCVRQIVLFTWIHRVSNWPKSCSTVLVQVWGHLQHIIKLWMHSQLHFIWTNCQSIYVGFSRCTSEFTLNVSKQLAKNFWLKLKVSEFSE